MSCVETNLLTCAMHLDRPRNPTWSETSILLPLESTMCNLWHLQQIWMRIKGIVTSKAKERGEDVIQYRMTSWWAVYLRVELVNTDNKNADILFKPAAEKNEVCAADALAINEKIKHVRSCPSCLRWATTHRRHSSWMARSTSGVPNSINWTCSQTVNLHPWPNTLQRQRMITTTTRRMENFNCKDHENIIKTNKPPKPKTELSHPKTKRGPVNESNSKRGPVNDRYGIQPCFGTHFDDELSFSSCSCQII